jgi:opacity protein-like surface antigen
MKKITLYLVVLTFAVFMSSNTFSQGGFSIHAGTAIPISDFGDDDLNNEEGGGAAIGFNFGAKYQYQLNESGLGLYLGANLNYNGLKKSLKDDMQELYDDMAGVDVDINFTKYLNIPVTAGLYYAYKANESVSLFGELGLGVDFLNMTDMKLEASGGEIKFKHKTKSQLAYEFGGGLMIQDKYIIELQYCGLGKHNVSTKMEYDGGSEDFGDSDLKVSLLTVSLGFKF